jgi:hypothetical protein
MWDSLSIGADFIWSALVAGSVVGLVMAFFDV